MNLSQFNKVTVGTTLRNGYTVAKVTRVEKMEVNEVFALHLDNGTNLRRSDPINLVDIEEPTQEETNEPTQEEIVESIIKVASNTKKLTRAYFRLLIEASTPMHIEVIIRSSIAFDLQLTKGQLNKIENRMGSNCYLNVDVVQGKIVLCDPKGF